MASKNKYPQTGIRLKPEFKQKIVDEIARLNESSPRTISFTDAVIEGLEMWLKVRKEK